MIEIPLAWKERKQLWMDKLHLNRVGDTVLPNGRMWTIREVERCIRRIKLDRKQKRIQNKERRYNE